MSRLDLETSIAYWEQAAGELLSRDPSEETRIVIEQGTKTIYKVLKNKISEEEAKLQAEIEVEDEAIHTLMGRIKESQSGTFNSDDTYLFDAKSLYQRIKGQEWCEVYDILADQTKDSETLICVKLINVLKECYSQCDHKIQSVGEEIKHEIESPGTTQPQKTKSGKPQKTKQQCKEMDELSAITQEFLKKTGPGIFPYHKQSLIDQVTTSKAFKPIQAKGKAAENALETYATKCLEFCWIQILENKDVKLEDNLKQLGKVMPKSKKVTDSKFIVTWPALVDKGVIVVDAQYGNKADMASARKERESKPKGKNISEETENSIEQDIIEPSVNNKPDSKENNGQQAEAIKTTDLNTKLTRSKLDPDEPKQSRVGSPLQRPEKQQETKKQSKKDTPMDGPNRQQMRPRAEIDDNISTNSKTSSQTKNIANESSMRGKEQISTAKQDALNF